MNRNGTFHICSERNGNKEASCFNTKKFEFEYNTDTFFKLAGQYDFKVTQIDNKFEISLNGKILLEDKNVVPITPKDIQVYVSSPGDSSLSCKKCYSVPLNCKLDLAFQTYQ